MFGLGFSEIVVLAVIGLLVLGPEELPKMARNIGRLFNDVKRSADDFKAEIQNHIEPPPKFDYQEHINPSPDQLAQPYDPKEFHKQDEQLELFEQATTAEASSEKKKEESSS